MAKKNLFCDIETSGLKIADGAVPLAIGFCLDCGADDPDPRTLVVMIKPTPEQWAQANPGALAVNGITWEQLEAEGVPMERAIEIICGWLVTEDINSETVRYIGQNPKFDVGFLSHFMGQELAFMGFPLDSPVDVIELAKQLARKDRSVRFISFKGHDIALTLGVEPEGAVHTALGGIMAVRRNYHALAKRLGLN